VIDINSVFSSVFLSCLDQETVKWPCDFESNCHLSTTQGKESPHYLTNTERQAEKLWIPIFKSLVWPDRELNPIYQGGRLYSIRPGECNLF